MSKAIYLGETARGTFIYADIRLTPGTEPRTMTDHTQGVANEVAISFTELAVQRNPRTAPDRLFVSSGQIQAADRVIARRARGLSADTLALIERAWADDHLNTMQAACDHMTPDMLNPTPEQLAAYLAEKPDAGRYGNAVMHYRADRVACPDTGYRYGHAWLTKAPNAADYAALAALVAE